MSQGVYGTSIPAYIDPQKDVEIWYNYKASRTTDSVNTDEYTQLSSSCLVKSKMSTSPIVSPDLEGMYSLKLPLAEFSKVGFYSVYIKPKEYSMVIADIAPLSAYADVKGIVIDTNNVGDSNLQNMLRTNNALVG